jgi:hypothetical protein
MPYEARLCAVMASPRVKTKQAKEVALQNSMPAAPIERAIAKFAVQFNLGHASIIQSNLNKLMKATF